MSEPNPTVDAPGERAWRVRRLVQWLWGGIWLVTSLWPLSMATYHYWGARRSPTANPVSREAWGNAFFTAGLVCWALAALGVWLMGKESSLRYYVGTVSFSPFMAVVVMALAIWAVPGWGKLPLLGAAILGACWAVVRLRRLEVRK
jgi:hypothetical protein